MKNLALYENFLNEGESDVTLNVTISNIDQSTAKDFLKMFAYMEWTGAVGTSRSMEAFFDGDGHFRPKITVDGTPVLKLGDFSQDWDEDGDGISLGFGA